MGQETHGQRRGTGTEGTITVTLCLVRRVEVGDESTVTGTEGTIIVTLCPVTRASSTITQTRRARRRTNENGELTTLPVRLGRGTTG